MYNSLKFRVLYGSLNKLAEVPGGYVIVVPVTAPRYFTKCGVSGIPGIRYYHYFRVFTLHKAGDERCTRTLGIVARAYRNGGTEHSEVSSTGMIAVQNSQKFRVRVMSVVQNSRSRGSRSCHSVGNKCDHTAFHVRITRSTSGVLLMVGTMTRFPV